MVPIVLKLAIWSLFGAIAILANIVAATELANEPWMRVTIHIPSTASALFPSPPIQSTSNISHFTIVPITSIVAMDLIGDDHGCDSTSQHALAIKPRVLITEPLRSDLSLPAPLMPTHRSDSESDSAPTSNVNLSVAGDSTSQHAPAIEPRAFITGPLCPDLSPPDPSLPTHHFDSNPALTSATADSIASVNLSVAAANHHLLDPRQHPDRPRTAPIARSHFASRHATSIAIRHALASTADADGPSGTDPDPTRADHCMGFWPYHCMDVK